MNYLKDIIHRLRSGESERRISRDLQISRPTVHKYYELSKRKGFLDPEKPMPDHATLLAALGPGPQPPKMISSLEAHRAVVEELLKQGLEKMAVWQRLRDNYGYTGSYSAVRRFVSQMETVEPEAYTRVHTAPGEEMQVDFGTVGQLYDPETSRIRTAYVFVATLSYSRHQYAELVFDQKVTTWITLHRRAFEWFGGVVKRVVPDNLKAGVIQALVYDPVLGEAYRKMALHYGFMISPNRPGTPRHKGKVENGVLMSSATSGRARNLLTSPLPTSTYASGSSRWQGCASTAPPTRRRCPCSGKWNWPPCGRCRPNHLLCARSEQPRFTRIVM